MAMANRKVILISDLVSQSIGIHISTPIGSLSINIVYPTTRWALQLSLFGCVEILFFFAQIKSNFSMIFLSYCRFDFIEMPID